LLFKKGATKCYLTHILEVTVLTIFRSTDMVLDLEDITPILMLLDQSLVHKA
jgi:hypothetical protein